jgi:phospholipase/carboxylesterase
MSYSQTTIILQPLSEEKPKSAVILCHGYGGDGKDISILANYWRAHLPHTIFICPDAPEKCAASPSGFQWFDLMDQTPDQVLSKSLVAENKLNTLIDEVKDKNNLSANQIVIGGFSQGCMISLQTGIKRKDTIN